VELRDLGYSAAMPSPQRSTTIRAAVWLGSVGVLAFAAGVGLPAGTAQPTVRIDTGQLSGTAEPGGVVAYRGIPYAAPPVGELRWKAPQPAAHWTGVRAADRFGTSCMQNQPGSRLPWTEEFMTQGPVGEDCLFLNVWTPAATSARPLPVMFWIYGGGFNEGSSSVAVYDGAALAHKGVVLVSVNYRVGPLGFLVHPELSNESGHHTSGNYGLLDQIAALAWVHRNIAAFGGDPEQVTIFGQSAGALSVYDLMQSPLAKGLFARAIAESGPGLLRGRPTAAAAALAAREAAGVRYAASKGAHSLAELRALPARTFFEPSAPGAAPPGGAFQDGWVVPDTPSADQVPLIVGMVADDIGVGGGPPASQASTEAEIAARKEAGREAARVSIDVWAADQVKASKQVYTYFFDRAIPWPAHPEFGAFHTSEVPYVFQTIHRLDRPWQPVDDRVSDIVSSYWVNFAKDGDPNGAGLPAWPAYVPGRHVTMELGERMGPMPEASPAAGGA
jgi:para-nitrobenzyl esterase